MLGLYLRTARHFRSSQILARLRKEADARLVRQLSWLAESRYIVPARRARRSGARFVAPEDSGQRPQGAMLRENANRLEQGIFRLLNKDVALGTPVNWNPEKTTRLWRYNLHYFDYALDLALVARWDLRAEAGSLLGQLFHDWTTHNPIAHGVGWNSYPIARRIVNWIQSASLASTSLLFESAERESEWVASLYAQAQYLEDHLEYDCLGNHLLADAKALVFAGLFLPEKPPTAGTRAARSFSGRGSKIRSWPMDANSNAVRCTRRSCCRTIWKWCLPLASTIAMCRPG